MADSRIRELVSREITSFSYNGTIIRDYLLGGCRNLTTISAPNVTTIGNSALYATAVESINFPNAITVGSFAFYRTTSLTDVSLPNVTLIEARAFILSQIAEIELPSVIDIRDGAFWGCGKLTSISIPNAKTIGAGAFNTTKIVLSPTTFNSVESIGGNAFVGLSGGQEYYFPNIVTLSANSLKFSSSGNTYIIGDTLQTAEAYVCGYDSATSSGSANIRFLHSASASIPFNVGNFLDGGGSKGTYTYNIYTDNATIKDGCLARAGSYTIVNVYHLDGSEWT